jgi:hypothetical protein
MNFAALANVDNYFSMNLLTFLTLLAGNTLLHIFLFSVIPATCGERSRTKAEIQLIIYHPNNHLFSNWIPAL